MTHYGGEHSFPERIESWQIVSQCLIGQTSVIVHTAELLICGNDPHLARGLLEARGCWSQPKAMRVIEVIEVIEAINNDTLSAV